MRRKFWPNHRDSHILRRARRYANRIACEIPDFNPEQSPEAFLKLCRQAEQVMARVEREDEILRRLRPLDRDGKLTTPENQYEGCE